MDADARTLLLIPIPITPLPSAWNSRAHDPHRLCARSPIGGLPPIAHWTMPSIDPAVYEAAREDGTAVYSDDYPDLYEGSPRWYLRWELEQMRRISGGGDTYDEVPFGPGALVLVWAGTPDPLGIARARDVLRTVTLDDHGDDLDPVELAEALVQTGHFRVSTGEAP